VAVGAGAAAAGAAGDEDTSTWAHESDDEAYGFAEGPFSEEAGYQAGESTETGPGEAQYDESAPTEVFEAVRPKSDQ
jgi:hypothetical protein